MESLSALSDVITEVPIRVTASSSGRSSKMSKSTDSGASVAFGAQKGIGLEFSGKASDAMEVEQSLSYQTQPDDYVILQAISRCWSDALTRCGTRIYVLLDEWSSLPSDIQPLLADFIRRTLFTVQPIAIKIATIKYRSDFSKRLRTGALVGFELGADLAADLDIDQHYKLDRGSDQMFSFYAEILYDNSPGTTNPRWTGCSTRASTRLTDRVRVSASDLE